MKFLKYSLFVLFAVSILSCNKDEDGDDDVTPTAPEYSITIMSPSTDDKKLNDEIHVHVNFDEANKQTIHHVNVTIYEKGNEEHVIFNKPTGTDVHVMESSGHYEIHGDVKLDEANGVMAHTDWIVKAKIWGHEDGASEVIVERGFHVHPE